jgi:hypothetical protein
MPPTYNLLAARWTMKKKLRLQIEKLRVEQFEVQPNSSATRGTVHGLETDHYSASEDRCICMPVPETWSCTWAECC